MPLIIPILPYYTILIAQNVKEIFSLWQVIKNPVWFEPSARLIAALMGFTFVIFREGRSRA